MKMSDQVCNSDDEGLMLDNAYNSDNNGLKAPAFIPDFEIALGKSCIYTYPWGFVISCQAVRLWKPAFTK